MRRLEALNMAEKRVGMWKKLLCEVLLRDFWSIFNL